MSGGGWDRTEQTLYVQFNGTEVSIATDVPAVADYVKSSHGFMLVSAPERIVGTIEVFETERGFSYRSRGELDFEGEVSRLFDLLSRDIFDAFRLAHENLIWLHAGAVQSEEGEALLIVGPSAQGKSTLATGLAGLGWRYMSDETAPVDLLSDQVFAYPRTPVRRLNPGRSVSITEGLELMREHCELTRTQVHLAPARVGSIVFPAFEFDAAAAMTSVSPGDAAIGLIRNCIGFPRDRALAVKRFGEMCSSRPAYRLTYGDGAEAAALLDKSLGTNAFLDAQCP
jgi:hypothetical protein